MSFLPSASGSASVCRAVNHSFAERIMWGAAPLFPFPNKEIWKHSLPGTQAWGGGCHPSQSSCFLASSLWLLKSTTDIKALKVPSDTLILSFNSHLISAYFIINTLLGVRHILKTVTEYKLCSKATGLFVLLCFVSLYACGCSKVYCGVYYNAVITMSLHYFQLGFLFLQMYPFMIPWTARDQTSQS